MGKILIKDPGSLCSTQSHLQGWRNYYQDYGTRNSVIDPAVIVLDVHQPIIMPNPGGPLLSYIVVEGHTRCYEATRRNVGIEAQLTCSIEEILSSPPECFRRLSRERCVEIFSKIGFYQKEANDEGIMYIRDLLRK